MNEQAAAPLMPSVRGRYREVWVGAFVLLGLVASLALLFTLTSPATFRGRAVLEVTVPDASGIRRGDPVQMRGVTIGRVRDFELTDQGVTLQLEVEREYPIPADSRVELRSNNLLGEMVASVLPGKSERLAGDGAVLPGVVGSQPFGQVGEVAEEASTTLSRITSLLDEETVGHLQGSSGELHSALGELATLAADQRAQLHALTSSLRRSATGLEGAVAGPELQRSVQRLDALTARLDATARSAQTVLGRIERGEGSLGKLTRDEALYRNANAAVGNLSRAAQEFSELAADIRRDPGRYLKISVF